VRTSFCGWMRYWMPATTTVLRDTIASVLASEIDQRSVVEPGQITRASFRVKSGGDVVGREIGAGCAEFTGAKSTRCDPLDLLLSGRCYDPAPAQRCTDKRSKISGENRETTEARSSQPAVKRRRSVTEDVETWSRGFPSESDTLGNEHEFPATQTLRSNQDDSFQFEQDERALSNR
jgi:hypothetical protein